MAIFYPTILVVLPFTRADWYKIFAPIASLDIRIQISRPTTSPLVLFGPLLPRPTPSLQNCDLPSSSRQAHTGLVSTHHIDRNIPHFAPRNIPHLHDVFGGAHPPHVFLLLYSIDWVRVIFVFPCVCGFIFGWRLRKHGVIFSASMGRFLFYF